jgi:hypothetical protein
MGQENQSNVLVQKWWIPPKMLVLGFSGENNAKS